MHWPTRLEILYTFFAVLQYKIFFSEPKQDTCNANYTLNHEAVNTARCNRTISIFNADFLHILKHYKLLLMSITCLNGYYRFTATPIGHLKFLKRYLKGPQCGLTEFYNPLLVNRRCQPFEPQVFELFTNHNLLINSCFSSHSIHFTESQIIKVSIVVFLHQPFLSRSLQLKRFLNLPKRFPRV